MKILSNKKVEKLFDDILLLDYIGSEMFIAATNGDIKKCIMLQEKLVESSMNAVNILKGMKGCFILTEIHRKKCEQSKEGGDG